MFSQTKQTLGYEKKKKMEDEKVSTDRPKKNLGETI